MAQLSYRGNGIFTSLFQKKVTTRKPTHPPALVPSEASLCTQKDFRLPTAESHCEEDTCAAPFTRRTPSASQNRRQHLFHGCARPVCEDPRAAGHALSHRPARKPGVAGKSPHKQQLPQDSEAGKGGTSLPGNLCYHLHLCCSSALPSRRAR